jgi:chemotaxis protein methyltransferase WspC
MNVLDQGLANNGARAQALLQKACGLQVSASAAERAVRERMAARGAPDPFDPAAAADYLDHLSGPELAALIELVVVPESWMYRDPDAFAAATGFVRQRLLQRPQRQVRILSLPCAGGEEPYTMAMALHDAGVPAPSYRIDAMDLSSVALERARAGWYTKNAFRGRSLEFRERHFSVAGNGYQIHRALRDQVTFMQANILAIDTDAGAGRYDVIFCRNLLIYFDAPTTAAAVTVLRTLLADDGMLLSGYAEVPAFCANGFQPLRLPGAFALQKAAETAPSACLPIEPGRAPLRVRRPPPPPVAQMAPPRPSPAIAPSPTPATLLAEAKRQADNGDYRGAAASCHQLLKNQHQGLADQDAAEAYYLLGLVADIDHKNGAADDYWRRCVYLRPDHYEALCRLALLSEQTGHGAQAAVFRQRAARVFQRREQREGAR